MNTYARLSLVLFIICAISAGALALADAATRSRIRANEEYKERILRGKALAGEERGGAVVFDPQPVEIEGREYYIGRLDGKFAGTAFTAVTNKGYSGPIEVVIAMDEVGEKIAGVRIKSHSETPGLGANATQIKYGDIEPWFLAQFSGKEAQEARLKADDPNGEIDAITAATITSRAVTNCVQEAASDFSQAWDKLKVRLEHGETAE
ncbi:MAG: RnfABCDGE type electron transport complex subunit G [Candidatus Abyssobacteria bacterium SURF_17]|uniref:Ion-translocating oxidoreductase complex subunit G n=1 Tax=Candidatus Abyssobacteria bacterium SURF_17 TaxID=2093361 RepID=A0A419F1X7_9BACT|nr:MAG: RnfABCDGE type electron transport complex subunit G [Candidatus Abyssubacteria bacterium SURF_17]